MTWPRTAKSAVHEFARIASVGPFHALRPARCELQGRRGAFSQELLAARRDNPDRVLSARNNGGGSVLGTLVLDGERRTRPERETSCVLITA